MASADELLDRIDVELERLAALLDGEGRDDLVNRVDAARARLARPSTVVCVVGEFKQGKSSLVNALIESDVCPVDDDVATSAITLVRYGAKPGAVVRRRVDGEPTAERIGLAEVARFVSESGNPANEQGVERVDVVLPAPALDGGLALVDTPGAGGMAAGHGAATLAFLPFADGLVFVTDASSELTEPELAFLGKARELCPTVMVVVTKIDIAPEWRRILDLDRAHLATRGLDVPVVPVSSLLRRVEDDEDRRTDRSGFGAMTRALADDVIRPARASAAQRVADEVGSMVAMVGDALRREQAVLDDASSIGTLEAEVTSAVERLERLRGPGAKWATVMADRVADLSSEVNFRFRGDVRELLRRHEEAIEKLTSSEQWEAQAQVLQGDVAGLVTTTFAAIEHGRASVRDTLIELLAAEDAGLSASAGAGTVPLDVTSMWRSKKLDTVSARSRAVQTSITGLRGAQSGIMLFGLAGQFLPAATMAMISTNPVLLTIGAVFGTMQLVEDRKRKVTQRRQGARTQLRQFVDDVQFEVGNEISSQIRNLQRDLRDEFSGLLGELQRTWTESLQRSKSALARSTEERSGRSTELGVRLGQLGSIATAVETAAGELAALPEEVTA